MVEKPFIRVGLGGSSDGPIEARRFLLRRQATHIPAEIPLYHVMAYAIQLEPSGRTEELTCRLSPMTSSNRESFSCAHSKARALWQSQPFLVSQDETGLHLQLPACSKTPRVLRKYQLLVFEAFYKESFSCFLSSIPCSTHPIRNEVQKMKISVNYPNALRDCHNKVLVTANKHFSSFFIRNS